MDLIDDYLQTLRILLPWDKRDDIIRELSEEMRSEASEQEAVLGRPLQPSEQAQMLRKYGHPLLTAARYRPQRYLIGPVLFPYYALTLGAILALVLTGHAIGAIVLVTAGEPIRPILENTIEAVLSGIGWFTLVAACLDFWLSRSGALEKWDPSKGLPPLTNAATAVRRALEVVPGGQRAPVGFGNAESIRGKAFAPRFVAAVAVNAWLLLAFRFPYLLFGPGAEGMSWGAAMDRIYPILALGQAVMLVQSYRELRRSGNIRFGSIANLASGVIAVAFLYLVVTSDHQWLLWHGAAEATARTNVVLRLAGRDVSVIDFVNMVFSAIFLFVGTAVVIGSVRSVLTRLTGGGPRAAHA